MELPSRWQRKVWHPTLCAALKIQSREWQVETWKLKTRTERQLPKEIVQI